MAELFAPNRPFAPPGWPLGVRIYQSSRHHAGDGPAPFGFNVALHVGDDPSQVLANRLQLLDELTAQGVRQINWLNQVHGTGVCTDADRLVHAPVDADAAVTTQAGRALAIMTADCLPVVLCDAHGQVVANVHAGWRGLHAGVIEAAAAKMPAPPAFAWLGPCIGAAAFEVGDEVRAAFVDADADAAHAFARNGAGRWCADLVRLARQRLTRLGVDRISGADACTVSDGAWFSYRRDGRTGRLVTLVWRTGD